MIVHGVSADLSIAKLFMAGVLPGILLATLFSGCLVVRAVGNSGKVTPADAPMRRSRCCNSWRRRTS